MPHLTVPVRTASSQLTTSMIIKRLFLSNVYAESDNAIVHLIMFAYIHTLRLMTMVYCFGITIHNIKGTLLPLATGSTGF